MNPHGNGKPEPADPDQVLRLLDLELMRQRAARQQASARRNNVRALSFLFLFVVLLGAALAVYFAFSSGRLENVRTRNSVPATPAPAMVKRP